MPNRSIPVELYRVQMPEGGSGFEILLQEVQRSPRDHTRFEKVYKNPCCLRDLHVSKNFFEGDMVKLRMDTGATKGNVNSVDLDEIPLKEEEGLAESAAFLYHAPTQTLALQHNRVGISASAMALYFEIKLGVRPILMDPVLHPEAIKRLAEMSELRSFTFRVAGALEAELFAKQGWTGRQVLALMKQFRAPSIEIRVSLSHQPSGSLSKSKVMEAAREFLRVYTGAEVAHKKMEVLGKTRDDEKRVVDLIEDRITEEMFVESQNRTLTYDERRAAVREAWLRHEQDVKALYGSQS